jgi:hypothetical protein
LAAPGEPAVVVVAVGELVEGLAVVFLGGVAALIVVGPGGGLAASVIEGEQVAGGVVGVVDEAVVGEDDGGAAAVEVIKELGEAALGGGVIEGLLDSMN